MNIEQIADAVSKEMLGNVATLQPELVKWNREYLRRCLSKLGGHEAADEIESLRQQLIGMQGRFEKDQDRIKCQAEQLAASQLREQQLRSQILIMIDRWWPFVHGSVMPSDAAKSLFEQATEALCAPQDTAVLDQLKAQVAHEAGEVMRDRCAYLVERQRTGLRKEHTIQLREAEYTIRTLPGVTLEDLE